MMTITEVFPQLDGGIRYLIEGQKGSITVDVLPTGTLQGFVRVGHTYCDEHGALMRAFALVRHNI